MTQIKSNIVEAALRGVYLHKRENGTYRVRVDVIIDGEKITRTTTYYSEKKFSEEENRRAAKITGQLFAEGIVKEYEDKKKGMSITFGEYYEKEFKERSKARYEGGTYDFNIHRIEKIFLEEFKDIEIRKFNRNILQDMLDKNLKFKLNENVDEEPDDPTFIKSQTAKRYMSAPRAVLRLAFEDGILEEDPSEWGLKYSKIYYTPVPCLDNEDYNDIVKEFKKKAEHHTLERNDIIVAICLLAGLRRGEMVALRWCDVPNIGRRANDAIVISISKSAYKAKGKKQILKDVKTTYGVREFTVSETLGCVLSAWKTQLEAQGIPTGGKNHIVCNEDGDMVSVYSPTDWFKDYLEAHNLPGVKLHSLRHTFASMMIANGTDILKLKKLMGHKDITTTQIYAHMFETKHKTIMSGLNSYDLKLFEEKEEENKNENKND